MIVEELTITAANPADGTLTLHGVAPTDTNAAGDLSGLTLQSVRFEGDWQAHRRVRGYSKGGFVSPGERTEVGITLAGQAWGYDRADANRLYRRLIETLRSNNGDLATLTFTPEDYGPVDVAATVEQIRATGSGPATIDFRAELVSPDGIGHGQHRTRSIFTGLPYALTNEGNADAYPTITLVANGTIDELTITNGNKTATFTDLALSNGDEFLYETQPGRERLTINGTAEPAKFSRPRIGLEVPAGGATFTATVVSGAGTASGTIEHRDAWLVA